MARDELLVLAPEEITQKQDLVQAPEEYNKSQEHKYERKSGDYKEGFGAGETKDRGLFDFLGKKASLI
ncbi:hypothetical protein ACFX13_014983 [Malus domestica]